MNFVANSVYKILEETLVCKPCNKLFKIFTHLKKNLLTSLALTQGPALPLSRYGSPQP